MNRKQDADEDVVQTFAAHLRDLVEQAGGQMQFAKLAGARQQTISGWTRGVSTPDVPHLARICRAGAATPNWMLGWETDEITPDERRFLTLYRSTEEEMRDMVERMLTYGSRDRAIQ